MDYGIKSRGVRNTVYAGLTALALAGCGGGSGGSPIPPPVNKAPTINFSVSPSNGYAPLETIVEGSCNDPDGDSVTYRVFANDQEISTSNPSSLSNLITEDTTYRAECTDSKGASVSREVSIDVKHQEVGFMKGPFIDAGKLRVDEDGNPIELVNERTLVSSTPGLYPSYSSDGSNVYLTVQQGTNRHSIYRANADNGSDLQDITSHLSGAESMKHQDLCSNGEMVVAYSSNSNSEEGLGILNSEGNIFTPILTVESSSTSLFPAWPSWNNDCSKIVFSGFDGNWDIYSIDRDGSNIVNLTDHEALDNQPSFSPDGKTIVFSSDISGESDICAMDSNGNNQVCFSNPGRESDPVFSLDGKYILSVNGGADFSNHQLEMRRNDGTGLVRLTSGEGGYRYPVFRPRQ